MANVIIPNKYYVLLPSAARTDHTTNNQVTQYNYNFRGMRLTYDISALTGTSITFTITGYDPISGNSTGTILASAAETGAATKDLIVFPGIAVTSNRTANVVMPRVWKLVPSGSISSVTYSIAVEMIP